MPPFFICLFKTDSVRTLVYFNIVSLLHFSEFLALCFWFLICLQRPILSLESTASFLWCFLQWHKSANIVAGVLANWIFVASHVAHEAVLPNVLVLSLLCVLTLQSTGDQALEILQYLFSNDLDVPVGHIVHTGMLNEGGGYENDCSIARLNKRRWGQLPRWLPPALVPGYCGRAELPAPPGNLNHTKDRTPHYLMASPLPVQDKKITWKKKTHQVMQNSMWKLVTLLGGDVLPCISKSV